MHSNPSRGIPTQSPDGAEQAETGCSCIGVYIDPQNGDARFEKPRPMEGREADRKLLGALLGGKESVCFC